MYTQCTQCKTIFRVTAEQLRSAKGKVRCGQCSTVFDGLFNLIHTRKVEAVKESSTPPSEAEIAAPANEGKAPPSPQPQPLAAQQPEPHQAEQPSESTPESPPSTPGAPQDESHQPFSWSEMAESEGVELKPDWLPQIDTDLYGGDEDDEDDEGEIIAEPADEADMDSEHDSGDPSQTSVEHQLLAEVGTSIESLANEPRISDEELLAIDNGAGKRSDIGAEASSDDGADLPLTEPEQDTPQGSSSGIEQTLELFEEPSMDLYTDESPKQQSGEFESLDPELRAGDEPLGESSMVAAEPEVVQEEFAPALAGQGADPSVDRPDDFGSNIEQPLPSDEQSAAEIGEADVTAGDAQIALDSAQPIEELLPEPTAQVEIPSPEVEQQPSKRESVVVEEPEVTPDGMTAVELLPDDIDLDFVNLDQHKRVVSESAQKQPPPQSAPAPEPDLGTATGRTPGGDGFDSLNIEDLMLDDGAEQQATPTPKPSPPQQPPATPDPFAMAAQDELTPLQHKGSGRSASKTALKRGRLSHREESPGEEELSTMGDWDGFTDAEIDALLSHEVSSPIPEKPSAPSHVESELFTPQVEEQEAEQAPIYTQADPVAATRKVAQIDTSLLLLNEEERGRDKETRPGGDEAPPPELLMQLHKIEQREAARRPLISWLVGSIFLLLAGLTQYAHLNSMSLGSNASYQGWVGMVCQVTGCELPMKRAIDDIELVDHSVSSHPDYDDTLLIMGTLLNNANHQQPYPTVEIMMTDLEKQVVASRRFTLQDYLPKERQILPFESQGRVAIELEVLDPGPQAVGFEFKFY